VRSDMSAFRGACYIQDVSPCSVQRALHADRPGKLPPVSLLWGMFACILHSSVLQILVFGGSFGTEGRPRLAMYQSLWRHIEGPLGVK
jgi:hypothetical protein